MAWIIIAPLVFASTKLCFCCLNQISAFVISWSSVAIGLRSKATIFGAYPAKVNTDEGTQYNWMKNSYGDEAVKHAMGEYVRAERVNQFGTPGSNY